MRWEEVVAAIPTMYTASSDSDLMTPLVIGHHRTYSMKLKVLQRGDVAAYNGRCDPHEFGSEQTERHHEAAWHTTLCISLTKLEVSQRVQAAGYQSRCIHNEDGSGWASSLTKPLGEKENEITWSFAAASSHQYHEAVVILMMLTAGMCSNSNMPLDSRFS